MFIRFTMDKRLRNLQKDDVVYVVYDKNYDNANPTEFVVVKGYVVENKPELVEYSTSDWYDDTKYTREEMYIEVTIGSLGKKYHRYYTPGDCYDNGGYLPMTDEILIDDRGPYIEVYKSKEDAKDAYVARLNKHIESSQEIIDKESKKIEVYQNNLKNFIDIWENM